MNEQHSAGSSKELVERYEKHVQAAGFLRLGAENKRLLAQFADWLSSETNERAKLCHGKAHVPITTCATCGCFIGSVTDLPGAELKASAVQSSAPSAAGPVIAAPSHEGAGPATVGADPLAHLRWICIHCTTVSGVDDPNCLGCGKPRYPRADALRTDDDPLKPPPSNGGVGTCP